MINRDRKCKTLTDKRKSHKKAKFMNSDRQIDRQTDRQKKIVLTLKDKLPLWEITSGSFQPNARGWMEKYLNLPKIICGLDRLAIIRTN